MSTGHGSETWYNGFVWAVGVAVFGMRERAGVGLGGGEARWIVGWASGAQDWLCYAVLCFAGKYQRGIVAHVLRLYRAPCLQS